MTTQSEQTLENNLLKQLQGMKYERVVIRGEKDLLANLKAQLEKHNKTTFTDKEFQQILNHLSKGNVFDKAQTLRDKFVLKRDNKNFYVEFFNQKEWCQNEYQIANQITISGQYKNRYDVTIIINGLPLVQCELKRRGLEIKEAFNQVNRYRKHSYASGLGLFQYVQLFVISNGVNTKYYSNTVGYDNDKKVSFKFTSYWADKDSKHIRELSEFTSTFLERCHLSKMITKHIVLTEDKKLMVLRPYQYYAVEAIVDKVKNSTTGGYIWHTTGSGKTLTSFKASQIVQELPEIFKVVFVVDRNDLDTQTIKEFNKFKEDSVDTTDNTSKLVKQFGDPDTKLIVTTIQKLNNAIRNQKHMLKMDKHRDKKIVFIFDECHRSQFGETHQRIVEYFNNKQFFGFTGTPIFAENASGSEAFKKTTADLFGDALHKYVITDAISDENVLKFSVEYVGRYKRKDTATEQDIEVEAIDTKQLMESPQRLEKIVDYILANHDRKTHARDFNAIFAVSSVDVLCKYYELFRMRQEGRERQLKVATIFSYQANENDITAEMLDNDNDLQLSLGSLDKHSRDRLERYIGDYNTMFGSNYTTKDSKSFYNYYRDIADRAKKREVDILLVVNMFLTGFDSPTLNTLYVDKNLRYHGLLQAYSRTNRILNETKSQGNIVSFRNLKRYTDQALELFANKDAEEKIFIQPYEVYVRHFDEAVATMQKLTPTPPDVDGLVGEEKELEFVRNFREVMRLRNVLSSFTDFKFDDVSMSEQMFEDFKSKYLDIYNKVQSEHEKEKVSILEDVDFELELIRRDEINVDYIIRLLTKLVNANEEQAEKIKKNIFNIMSSEVSLMSKRELIEKFISSNLPEITDPDEVAGKFEQFWTNEKTAAFEKMCKDEGIMTEKLQSLIDDCLYNGRKPRGDDIVATLAEQPSILKRKPLVERISSKLNKFLETFIEGV